MTAILPRSFYARQTQLVARDLLGKVMVRAVAGRRLAGRIVETESYGGREDPGSHASNGPTDRNRVMFGPPGYLYVYFTYGMHFCMNVVTDQESVPGAVLVRALEPLEGIEIMERHRGGKPVSQLCNGPAKLCQALAITRRLNGADLESSDVWIEDDGYRPAEIVTTTRVGLTRGAGMPLRFYIEGSAYVSPGKPSSASVAPECRSHEIADTLQ